MLSGRVFREDKEELLSMSRSSVYLNAISNRLASSSQRARFLGMVLGMAISQLVDPEERRMKFSAVEIDSADGLWYQSLTSVHDRVGLITDLKAEHKVLKQSRSIAKPVKYQSNSTGKPTRTVGTTSKVVSIEELDDSSGTEDEDLPLYAKPDSDPSDEDEDPTLVQRNKPSAPV